MERINSVIASLLLSLSSAYSTNIIGIRADGEKETFTLSDVSYIKFNDGSNPTMSFVQTDGSIVNGFETVTFSNVDVYNGNGTVPSQMVMVYPNPVQSVIYIDGLEEDSHIKVLDTQGRVIIEVMSKQINVESLKSGMYLLDVNGKIVKFIKK